MEILTKLYCKRLVSSVFLRKQKSIVMSEIRTQKLQVGFRWASSTKKDQQKKPIIKQVNLMLSENHILFPTCEWAFSTREPRDQIIIDQALLQAKTVEKRNIREFVELDAHSRQEKNKEVSQKLGPKEFAVVPSHKDEIDRDIPFGYGTLSQLQNYHVMMDNKKETIGAVVNGLSKVKILEYERNDYGIHQAIVEVLDDKLPTSKTKLEELQNSLHEAVKKLVKLLGGSKKYKVYEMQNGVRVLPEIIGTKEITVTSDIQFLTSYSNMIAFLISGVLAPQKRLKLLEATTLSDMLSTLHNLIDEKLKEMDEMIAEEKQIQAQLNVELDNILKDVVEEEEKISDEDMDFLLDEQKKIQKIERQLMKEDPKPKKSNLPKKRPNRTDK